MPGVVPSREITWFQAAQACASSGKRLCSNAEWQTAASGTLDPGANDGFRSSRCNTLAAGPRQTGAAGFEPGSPDGCVSRYGVEDMIGNLWEWTGDWVQAGMPWMDEPGASATPWPDGFGGDGTWNVNGTTTDNRDGAAMHEMGWYDGLPAVLIRGGNWEQGERAGIFAVWLADNPSVANWVLGARCCR